MNAMGRGSKRVQMREKKRAKATSRIRSRRMSRSTRRDKDRATTLANDTAPDDWMTGPSERDDAPGLDKLPDWIPGDEDDPLFDDERDLPVEIRTWQPWVWLSIYIDDDGELAHRVHVPPSVTDDPAAVASLLKIKRSWSTTATILQDTLGDALRSESTTEAALSLRLVEKTINRHGEPARRVTGGSALERSEGQWSRDKLEIVRTPFGQAPLWFFAQAPRSSSGSSALFEDLTLLGHALMRGQLVVDEGRANLSKPAIEAFFSDLGRTPSIQPDSIRRGHGKALLAVFRMPSIVARHRSRWPATTPDELLDDLEVFVTRDGANDRSQAVATLALAGVFDIDLGIWRV